MAKANSTSRNDITTPLEASDALNHAYQMIEFLQGSLTTQAELDEHLNTTGLHFIFQDIKDRISSASDIFDDLRKAQ